MEKNQLVEMITREILQLAEKGQLDAIAGPAASAPVPSAPVGACRHPLVAVAGNPTTAGQAEAFFGRLRKAYPKLGVLLSPSAEKLFGGSRRVFAGFQLFPEQRDYGAQLELFDSLIVVNTTVNMVSKLAHLQADSATTCAVFLMLGRGKPVYITTDTLKPWLFNRAIEDKVNGYLRALSEYGICVTPFDGLFGMGASVPAGTTACEGCGTDDCAGCGQCVVRASDRVKAIVSSGADRVAASPGVSTVSADVARLIDHTMLKAEVTEDQIRTLCEEARQYLFASVCVNPGWVRLCSELLRGSGVKVCTVIGFPLGATTTTTKALETRDAVANGADEIDMVINVGALKAKDDKRVRDDIAAVVDAAGGRVVKVILETALLNDEEKRRACELSVEAGAHFVKTSTGFGPGGATVADIELMRKVVGPKLGVKASGGVRDLETARAMMKAGATRIGASASVAIVTGKKAGAGKY